MNIIHKELARIKSLEQELLSFRPGFFGFRVSEVDGPRRAWFSTNKRYKVEYVELALEAELTFPFSELLKYFLKAAEEYVLSQGVRTPKVVWRRHPEFDTYIPSVIDHRALLPKQLITARLAVIDADEEITTKDN